MRFTMSAIGTKQTLARLSLAPFHRVQLSRYDALS